MCCHWLGVQNTRQDPDEPLIEIFVRTDVHTSTVNIEASATISNLKSQLQVLLTYRKAWMRILYLGEDLLDERSLISYGVGEGAHLDMAMHIIFVFETLVVVANVFVVSL